MKHLSKVLLVVAVCLSGCASNMTMTGKAFPSVEPEQVKILFHDKPKCAYQELAFISTPLMWSQNTAIEEAREEAADIGANYLVINNVTKNGFNDASVSAIAYRCGNVDRHEVNIDPDDQ